MSSKTRILRNLNGSRIGTVETTREGNELLRDANGHRLGEYNPRQNATRNADGHRLGEGDTLTALLFRLGPL